MNVCRFNDNHPKLIAYASAGYRLYPGDGTPEGVGPVVDRDVVTSKVARLRTMTVRVSSTRRAHGARS
jgi:2-keto-4-pentenoate hydratase/2-oxohepta-3-ene-1,7-dioic acid hydratase in catechol pathway